MFNNINTPIWALAIWTGCCALLSSRAAAQLPRAFDDYWVSTNPDSLEKTVYAQNGNQEVYLHSLIALELSRMRVSEKAEQDLVTIKSLAEQTRSELGEAMYCYLMGKGLTKADLQASAYYFLEAGALFEARKDTVGMMATYLEMVALGYINNLYTIVSDIPAAHDYFVKTMALGEKVVSVRAKLIVYELMMKYNQLINNVDNFAEETAAFDSAIKIIDQNPKYEHIRFRFVEGFAGPLYRRKLYKRLLQQHIAAYKLREKAAPRYRVNTAYNVGDAYHYLNDFENAKKYYQIAIEISKCCPALCDKPLNLTYAGLSKIYFEQKYYLSAWRYRDIKDSLNDATQQTVMGSYLSNIEAKYKSGKKEAEINKLKQEREHQALITNLISIAGAFFILLSSVMVWFYIKTRRLNRLIESQNKELALANRRMEHFTDALSHDALGYITDILNYATIGKETTDSNSDVGNIVHRIHRSTGRLKKMAENLIGYNKMRRSNYLENFGLEALVDEVADDMSSELSLLGISLKTGKMPAVHADREFVKQVFRNLMGNAVKFRNPDVPFELEISAKNATNQPGFVEVKVRDNGIGIEAEKLPVIFDEFVKGNRAAEGSGLGLFICRQILESMGGQIWAESVRGTGSVFRFTLPKKSQ